MTDDKPTPGDDDTPADGDAPSEETEAPEEATDDEGTAAADEAAPRRGFFRRHRALTVLGVLVLVLLVAVGGWLVYLNSQLGNITRFDTDLDRPGRPERVPGDAQNILLIGVDKNQGDPDTELRDLGGQEWDPGSFRSDSMMLFHLEKGHDAGQLVSLPRDSWVPIPGHGENKLNAAFSLGGPELLAQTVEDLTQAHVDHVIIVDFAGFEHVTEVVDGVDVYVPREVYDSKQKKRWTKGTHHVEGKEALQYVRQRYGLPGGDFDRIQRQQNFLRAVVDKLASKGILLNPVKVTQLTASLADLIAVDDDFDNSEIRDLALSARGIRTKDLDFVTLPNKGTGTSSGGASIVVVDTPLARSLFTAVEDDEYDGWRRAHEVTELPDKREVD